MSAKIYVLMLLLPLFGLMVDSCQQPDARVYIVRHADRLGDADLLNDAGQQRSKDLMAELKNKGITKIYSTDTQRTRNTATPLAEHLNIELSLYNPNQLKELAKDIKAYSGGCILVVGHSNTAPATANFLGATPPLSDIHHDEYDHMYVITLSKNGDAHFEKREYGAASP